jgi:hypothetical protein
MAIFGIRFYNAIAISVGLAIRHKSAWHISIKKMGSTFINIVSIGVERCHIATNMGTSQVTPTLLSQEFNIWTGWRNHDDNWQRSRIDVESQLL